MVLLRLGFAIAALATGMITGFIFYKAPAPDPNFTAYQLAGSGHLADAVRIYSDQIHKTPQDYRLYLRRALILKESGQADAALSDFTTALKLSPPVLTAEALGDRLWNATLPETHDMTLVMELHTERAGVLEHKGRFVEALADLDAAVALNGHNGAARHHRAMVRAFAGQFDGAVADFDAVLARGMNLDSLFGRALTKYFAGDWDAAAADFARTVKLEPQSDDYAVWLLKAQLRDHQPIPLDQFGGLSKSSPAWARIDAFLSDYAPAEARNQLAESVKDDPAPACEAAALYGEWLEIKAAGEDAPAEFRDVLAHCKPATLPYEVATFEPNRLAHATKLVRTDLRAELRH